MVQAQLLKFFKKTTTEGIEFSLIRKTFSWRNVRVTVRDWETKGELTLSNFEKKKKRILRVQKHSLHYEAN